ncbi:MAG: Uma2 family endonuclease [Myxococcota bacterium]|nr:Uma2 family endonuclease [Myxococcota bacterium]
MTSPRAKHRATLDDLAAERDRGLAVELIEGEIVQKAAPLPAHGGAQMKLGELLGGFHRRTGGPRGPGGWWIMSEVEIAYPRTDEIFRHDALGFRRESRPERPEGMPVRARPDWVAEILSPSTGRYDVVKKQRTLHLHGVPHYWIVDPEHETLTVLRHAGEAYLSILSAGVGDVVRAEPFEVVEISISDLFGHD